MNRESLLSGVPALLRPDKLEFRSRDDDRDPFRSPLETEGDLNDGEETFEIVFLLTMLPPLSNDMEDTLLEEGVTDNTGLVEAFLRLSILASDPVDLLKLRPTGDTGTDFLVSETLARVLVGLVTNEGNELLLMSGSDRLTGCDSKVEVFFPTAEPAVVVCLVVEADDFSGNPPVLFLLVKGTEFVVFKEALTVGLVRFELRADPVLGSVFLLILELVATETFDMAATLGFPTLVTFFALSTELTGDCFSTGSSSVCTIGSSILGLATVKVRAQGLIQA